MDGDGNADEWRSHDDVDDAVERDASDADAVAADDANQNKKEDAGEDTLLSVHVPVFAESAAGAADE